MTRPLCILMLNLILKLVCFLQLFDLRTPSGGEMRFCEFWVFLHFKNEAKICKICNMAKIPLSSGQNVLQRCFFLRFRGVIRFIKVVSDFCFGDRKCHFCYPQKAENAQFQVCKNGTLDARNWKRRPLFHANTPPKRWSKHLCCAFPLLGGF